MNLEGKSIIDKEIFWKIFLAGRDSVYYGSSYTLDGKIGEDDIRKILKEVEITEEDFYSILYF